MHAEIQQLLDCNVKITTVSLVGSCLDEVVKKNNFDIETV